MSDPTVPRPVIPTAMSPDNPYARPSTDVALPVDRRRFWLEALPVAVVAAIAVPALIAAFSAIRGLAVPAFIASPGFVASLLVAAFAAAAALRILALPRWARYGLAPLATAGLMLVLATLLDAVF